MHIKGAEENAEYQVMSEKTAVVQVYPPYWGIPAYRLGYTVRQSEAEIHLDEQSRSKYLDLVRATVKEKNCRSRAGPGRAGTGEDGPEPWPDCRPSPIQAQAEPGLAKPWRATPI